MKKFIIGLFIGALVVLGLVVLAMSNGEPFEAAIVKYGTEGDTGYVVLPGRFVVIVENVEKFYQTSGGAKSVTISGRDSGRLLRVGSQGVALGDGIAAIVVDKERHVHVLSKASANEVYASLPPFCREDTMNIPPPADADAHNQSEE